MNMRNDMRNETCVETQTSKVPTRVAFLFISILWFDDRTMLCIAALKRMEGLSQLEKLEVAVATQDVLRSELLNIEKYLTIRFEL